MISNIRIFAGLVVLSVLGGCASTRMSNAEKSAAYINYIEQNKLEKVKRITTFRLHGWRYLNRDYVILSTSIRKPYLVEISGPCYELAYSHSIGIHHDGSTLTDRFDWVFAPSQPDIRCMIRSIHKLSREQADQLAAIGKSNDENNQESQQVEAQSSES